MEKKEMKIAVVGKSAVGKSAFIRSFSASPGLIDSVGKGQTTRCYGEYEFLLDSGTASEVEAKIASKEEFCGRMAGRAMEQAFERYEQSKSKMDIREWLMQEFCDPMCAEKIKRILLRDKAFFQIGEFEFLDSGIVCCAEEEFKSFKQDIMKGREEQEENLEEKEAQEREAAQKEWLVDNFSRFYGKIYDLIINALESSYREASFFSQKGKDMCFRFSVNEKNSRLLSRILKVDEEGKSLTGILSKVRVMGSLNEKYRECIRKSNPELESVTLIDTYGLDQESVAGTNVLERRYDDILNRDYPDISAVFFVARITHGAPSDFSTALQTLYRTKPDVMAYVVGTHIDEKLAADCGEEEKNWLYHEDKTKYKAPDLESWIWEVLSDNYDLIMTLYDSKVPETLARKRCEVMRKRFAPFCGKPENQTGNINYEAVNATSVKALFDSIALQEHMGDGIVSIAKINNGISTPGILEEFAGRFIEETRRQFRYLYIITWGKTRGKVRENLERYTMGFDGTTVNATWGNAFRRAFYQTFSRGSGRPGMLSDAFGMEEKEKIAFDEIMNKACGAMVWPSGCGCTWYYDERSCDSCGKAHKKTEQCIWNSFMREAGFETFGQSRDHKRVIDWLMKLHEFPDKNGELKSEIAGKLKAVLEEWVIPQCREHNEKIIAGNQKS